MRNLNLKSERKIITLKKFRSFVSLLALLVIVAACASNGNSQQKDLDQATACLEKNDILCALEHAKNLPDAEKARIRAFVHFKNQNYDGWRREVSHAINALKKRKGPGDEQLIRHLQKLLRKIDGIQISHKKRLTSSG